jgi:antitoxin protein of toxin-antitoxin system
MGASDKMNQMKDKAKDAMSGDDMKDKVDQAADKADEMTDEKYSDHIDKGADAIKNKMGDKE